MLLRTMKCFKCAFYVEELIGEKYCQIGHWDIVLPKVRPQEK